MARSGKFLNLRLFTKLFIFLLYVEDHAMAFFWQEIVLFLTAFLENCDFRENPLKSCKSLRLSIAWKAVTNSCAKQIRSTIVFMCSFHLFMCSFHLVMRSFHSVMYSFYYSLFLCALFMCSFHALFLCALFMCCLNVLLS